MLKQFTMALATLTAAGAFAAEFPDTTRLHEVVVTGSNTPVAERLLPYTVSVVGRQQLETSGNTQVLNVLSGMVPSMFVTQKGILGFTVGSNGGAGSIKMRGVGGDGGGAVLMMMDGRPQFQGIYSHSIADFYDKESVERVEVLRGPGSVLYGSNAMGGAINVITRKGLQRNGQRTVLQTQYGSYNTSMTSLTNSTRLGRFSSMVNAGYNRTDGNIKGMKFAQWEGYGKVAYDFSDHWQALADITLMRMNSDDPVYATLKNPESTDVYHQIVIRGETSLQASNTYATTSGAIRAYYSWGNHFVDDPRHFHSLDNRLGVIAYQSFKPWTGAYATVGFDFDRYTGKIPTSGGTSTGMGVITERKAITEYSPYLTLGQHLFDEMLSLSAGLRMANSDKFGTQWVPQFGFAVNPGLDFTLKGNLAMGYRNPSFRELYLYRMANPDLNPEKMMNYELSLGKHFGRWIGVQLTGYYAHGYDMIQAVDMHNENTGSFNNWGLEFTARSNPLDNLSCYFTYSFLHTSLSNLTGAPRHQYYIGADWRIIPQVSVGADLKGVARLFVAQGEPLRSFAVLNLHAAWDICRYVQIFTRLENLTDARYTINRGYPMPGFTAMGGLRLTI